jgi:hypothetical protein
VLNSNFASFSFREGKLRKSCNMYFFPPSPPCPLSQWERGQTSFGAFFGGKAAKKSAVGHVSPPHKVGKGLGEGENST